MYIGGMSSSLPEDVQYEMYRSVPGLEHAKIVKNAYAIEYDCIDARQLHPTLEFKSIHGLFSGGQFNGSSGYEEATAQGLIAGINAALEVLGREQLILDRSQAYIGVLIDDLVTKRKPRTISYDDFTCRIPVTPAPGQRRSETNRNRAQNRAYFRREIPDVVRQRRNHPQGRSTGLSIPTLELPRKSRIFSQIATVRLLLQDLHLLSLLSVLS